MAALFGQKITASVTKEGAGWRGKPGQGWQKEKKEPSQKLQAPPPCTLDTGYAITRVPDGPTSRVFANKCHNDAFRKQRQEPKPGRQEVKTKNVGLGVLVFRTWPLLTFFQLSYRCRFGHSKTLLHAPPLITPPPRVLREWWCVFSQFSHKRWKMGPPDRKMKSPSIFRKGSRSAPY